MRNSLRNIIRVTIGTLLTVYLVTLFVFNFSPARRWITDKAENALQEILQTKVEIEDIEVGLFNRLSLKNVTVYDQSGKQMLKAKFISAKIEWRSLVKDAVTLRTVSVLDGTFTLYKPAENSPANFQFVLDAFASKDKSKPSSLNLGINSLILRRCRVRYDEYAKPRTPQTFNVAHIALSAIDANISLKKLSTDSLNLRVRHLAAKEQCGLDLRELTFIVQANRKAALLKNLNIEVGGSHIRQSELRLTYDAVKDWGNLSNTLSATGSLADITVATADIAHFVPALRPLPLTLSLSMDYHMQPQSGEFRNISIKESQTNASITGDCALAWDKSGLRRADLTLKNATATQGLLKKFCEAYIKNAETQKKILLCGIATLNARAAYRPDGESTADFGIATDAGEAKGTLAMVEKDIKGKISIDGLDLAKIIGTEKLPQNLSAEIKGNVVLPEKSQGVPDLNILATILNARNKDYDLRNIALNGKWQQGRFRFDLKSDNAPAALQLNGSGYYDGHTARDLALTANLGMLRPAALGFPIKGRDASISAKIEAALDRLTANQSKGFLQINDFYFAYNDSTPCTVKNLRLDVTPDKKGSDIRLGSDFLNFTFNGQLSLPKLKTAYEDILAAALPQLQTTKRRATPEYDWTFSVRLKNTDFFKHVLLLPLETEGDIAANGIFRNHARTSFFQLFTDGINYNGQKFKDLRLFVKGEKDSYNCLLQTDRALGGNNYKWVAELQTDSGTLSTNVQWRNPEVAKHFGEIDLLTEFSRGASNETKISTKVNPTLFTIGDTIWSIASGLVEVEGKTVEINNLRLKHDDQWLAVSGKLGKGENDSIVARLSKIDVAYILGLVDFHTVEFTGQATGRAVVNGNLKNPKLNAKIRVDDFHFNTGYMGTAHILGGWSKEEGRINLDAHIVEDGVGYTDVLGFVSLAEKGLDLDIKSEQTTLKFLKPYIGHIFTNLDGRTTGRIRLYGPFKKLDFVGEETASISAHLDVTGVDYTLTDGRVHVRPGIFEFADFKVADKTGKGTGIAAGALHHEHLKNLRYEFDLDVKNMLLYDRPREHDMPFYSTAYGTGKAKMSGRSGLFTADIDITTEAGTTLTYLLDTPDTYSDTRLLQFTSLDPKPFAFEPSPANTPAAPQEEKAEESTTDIKLNFQVNVNDRAQLRVITDDNSGDNIQVRGYGPMRATYYNKGRFELFGTYNVLRGTYKMSLQDIIRKDFTLQPGGTLVFTGPPSEGRLNFQAAYMVNSASLSDLNFGAGMTNNSVRVNCLLNITGQTKAPQVSFGLDFPTLGDEERRMVMDVINTEEDLNRQFVYLLGIGRFYNSNYAAQQQAVGLSQSNVAAKSFLSSTLTNQLNNIISNAMGGNAKWSIGTNISTGQIGWSDMEIDGLLQGRLLNDRLLINGNFGYRDNPMYATNFVGDFDIQYLLTPSGSISLKAYSETNERYFTKSSLTTQGIGIQLKRDFSNVRDLFTPRTKWRKKKDNK